MAHFGSNYIHLLSYISSPPGHFLLKNKQTNKQTKTKNSKLNKTKLTEVLSWEAHESPDIRIQII